MLTLPIKKQWFDMIMSGEKCDEYREIKPFYNSRFKKLLYEIFDVKFRNGYSEKSPCVICECFLSKATGRAEWGAEPDKIYYCLHIIKILEVNQQ